MKALIPSLEPTSSLEIENLDYFTRKVVVEEAIKRITPPNYPSKK